MSTMTAEYTFGSTTIGSTTIDSNSRIYIWPNNSQELLSWRIMPRTLPLESFDAFPGIQCLPSPVVSDESVDQLILRLAERLATGKEDSVVTKLLLAMRQLGKSEDFTPPDISLGRRVVRN